MSGKVNDGTLPGCGMRILSFLPMCNALALVLLGVKSGSKLNILCGVVYGVLSFAFPNAAPGIWILVMIHYAAAYELLKASRKAQAAQEQKKREVHVKTPPYLDVILPGADERRQSIPPKKTPIQLPELPKLDKSEPKIEPISPLEVMSMEDRFLRDMKNYAQKQGETAQFVPYYDERPSYERMDRRQLAWYFCWRSQVRGGNYPDTDLAYILLYAYELLAGCGWERAEEGQQKLRDLWLAYRERLPKLDDTLFPWSFDFARLHELQFSIPEVEGLQLPQQPAVRNLMIDGCSSGRPLKLPFVLVEALCAYSMTGSKFYKDGHQALMREAIPRVVALADAALLKKRERGILAVYGPNRTRKQVYYAFKNVRGPHSDERMEISVKAYDASEKLRSFINELVRYAENVLRGICGYRGRLRGVALDEETAALVEAFLKKEYGADKKEEEPREPRQRLQLDFDNIAALRAQSDEVRDALEVPVEQDTPKAELTDLEAVQGLMEELTAEEAALMDSLRQQGWECQYDPAMEPAVSAINRKANKWLACALLVREAELLIAEDDYRDELNRIYVLRMAQQVPEKPKPPAQENSLFDMAALSPEMGQLMEAMTKLQRQVVCVILKSEEVQSRLAAMAEEAMTMPEILIDEINDLATQYLDDILIDGFGEEPRILEQYEEELKKAMKQEET